jgi:acyl-CoA thioesterase FadM
MSHASSEFEVSFRSRGYEVDRSGAVALPVLLSYLEHTRWEWMHDDSLGLVDLLAEGHFFVVREQALEVLEPIKMRRDLRITGSLSHVGRSQVQVRHIIRDAETREVVAHARVVGLWLNPARRLCRLPDSMRAAVAEGAELPPVILEPPAFEPPEDAALGQVLVRPSDCDRFDHVNAGAWLRLVDDARIAAGFDCAGEACVLRYDQEALAGERLDTVVWRPQPGTAAIVLASGGQPRCRALIRWRTGSLSSAPRVIGA